MDKVIEGKKNNEDTRELEEKIDGLVYGLYQLTEKEIGIIENGNWIYISSNSLLLRM